MAKQIPFLISASITDFAPMIGNMEHVFAGLKDTGVDGIELVIGWRSRWLAAYYQKLSKKYELPILSIHQPIWSGLGIFDEKFVEIAQIVQTNIITFHPLPRVSLFSDAAKRYLERLAKIKVDTGLEILLENMPTRSDNFLTGIIYPSRFATYITQYGEVVRKYNLTMTLDTDHLRDPKPHTASWIDNLLPYIKNIHLSSFTATKTHLPLTKGIFDSQNFIVFLNNKKYSGLVTLEIHYPSMFNLFSYNFDAIQQSVAIIRSNF